MRFGVGAIFKNERPFILEWVAFHRAIGIDRFIIADNDSTDGTGELLASLARAGEIEFISAPGRAAQLPFYRALFRDFGSGSDWIALIDGDEFIVPENGARSIRPLMEQLGAAPDIGAVLMNWACYGSSGHERASAEDVTTRFTMRGPQSWPVNRHFKSIVRVPAFRDIPTPHMPALKPGFRFIHADGSDLIRAAGSAEGIGDEMAKWGGARVNHYTVKSREDCIKRKIPRGRGSVDAYIGAGYFEGHDRNDEHDPMPSHLVEMMRDERHRIMSVLSGALRSA